MGNCHKRNGELSLWNKDDAMSDEMSAHADEMSAHADHMLMKCMHIIFTGRKQTLA